jgi:K+:H+ antiporter
MPSDELAGRFLLSVAVIIVTGRLLALLLRRFRQPPVLGELVAGIVLGPSLLGLVGSDLPTVVIPIEVRPAIAAVGSIGLVLFMFMVGLQFEPVTLRRRRTAIHITAGAFLVPFVFGLALAAALYAHHEHVGRHQVAHLAFALFVATALTVTAFPVLARIVAEHGLQRSTVGQLAIGSAALQDVLGWTMLAVALASMTTTGIGRALQTLAAFAALLLTLIFVIRPIIRQFSVLPASGSQIAPGKLAFLFAVVAATAATTQLIGLHSVIGAFAAGLAFAPEERSRLSRSLEHSVRPLVATTLLPLFFVGPGLQTNVSGITSSGAVELALLIGCACAGKLIGAVTPARLAGFGWRDAGMIGALLNTRGSMELIVLSVGLSQGILDQSLFSELVCMTLVTTLMTGPLLRALAPADAMLVAANHEWGKASLELGR